MLNFMPFNFFLATLISNVVTKASKTLFEQLQAYSGSFCLFWSITSILLCFIESLPLPGQAI